MIHIWSEAKGHGLEMFSKYCPYMVVCSGVPRGGGGGGGSMGAMAPPKRSE